MKHLYLAAITKVGQEAGMYWPFPEDSDAMIARNVVLVAALGHALRESHRLPKSTMQEIRKLGLEAHAGHVFGTYLCAYIDEALATLTLEETV